MFFVTNGEINKSMQTDLGCPPDGTAEGSIVSRNDGAVYQRVRELGSLREVVILVRWRLVSYAWGGRQFAHFFIIIIFIFFCCCNRLIADTIPVFWMRALSFEVQGSWLEPTRLLANTRKTNSLPMMRSDTTQLVRLYCSKTVNHSCLWLGQTQFP